MAEVTETNIRTDVPAENQSVERCLTFESGDMTLFLSINNVTEIINDCAITHLPLVPDYIKGIINLRGQILPVVDIQMCIRDRLGNVRSKDTGIPASGKGRKIFFQIHRNVIRFFTGGAAGTPDRNRTVPGMLVCKLRKNMLLEKVKMFFFPHKIGIVGSQLV